MAAAADRPVRRARSDRAVPARDRVRTRGLLQQAARARLDARSRARAQVVAGPDSFRSHPTRRAAAAALGAHRARHGRLAGAELQPRALRQRGERAARRAVRDRADRYGRPPTDLLDRAPARPAPGVRHRPRGRASAGHGPRPRARACHLGDDHSARLLPAAAARPPRGNDAPRARPRPPHGRRDVRRARLDVDVGDRAAAGRRAARFDDRPPRRARRQIAGVAIACAACGDRVHTGGAPPPATRRFLHRKTRPGELERGGVARAAGGHHPQRLDHAARALQR